MKHKVSSILILAAGVVLGALACRQGPGTDPKTPPNSPIPKIEKPEENPVTPTSAPLPFRDAG